MKMHLHITSLLYLIDIIFHVDDQWSEIVTELSLWWWLCHLDDGLLIVELKPVKRIIAFIRGWLDDIPMKITVLFNYLVLGRFQNVNNPSNERK